MNIQFNHALKKSWREIDLSSWRWDSYTLLCGGYKNVVKNQSYVVSHAILNRQREVFDFIWKFQQKLTSQEMCLETIVSNWK